MSEAEAVPTRAYLLFSVGGTPFALPTDAVEEVAPRLPLIPIPRSDPHLLGVVNLRGRPVTALDLAVLLGVPPAGPPRRYLIATTGEHRVALPVGAVRGVEAIPIEDGRPLLQPDTRLLDLTQLVEDALARATSAPRSGSHR